MSVEEQITGFLAEYSPAIRDELKRARRTLRRLFPRGFELVFNNYNALVFAYSPTASSARCLVSIAGYPQWLTLFFAGGASLADPTQRLQGAGASIRSLRLNSATDLDEPDVRRLLAAAVAGRRKEFAIAPGRATLLKTVAARRRPRRPRTAPRGRRG